MGLRELTCPNVDARKPLYKTARLYPIIFLATLLTWLLHEYAHWQIGEWLGYRMRLTLNTATSIDGDYSTIQHYIMIKGAGPAITVGQAIVFWLIVMHTEKDHLFPFLYLPFFMRAIAFLVSFLSPNDEALIAIKLGLPFWSLPLFVTCFLALLTISVARQRNIDVVSLCALTVVSFVAALTIIIVDGVLFF